jgi:hypothetical protein
VPFAHINKIRINWLYQVRDLSQHFQLARLIPKAKLKAEAFNGAVLAFLRRVK